MTTQDVAGRDAAHGEEHQLARGPLWSAVIAVGVAQLALAIPAVLQGLFQKDLGPTSSQLTWISDAFLVPVTLLELTFGVVGDLFGRKRLLIGGAALLAIGEGVALLTPGLGTSTNTRVVVLWIGMALAGAGTAAIMPTSLAMLAAGTHTAHARARSVTLWAAGLSAGNMVSPVLGGWLAGFKWGSNPNASWRFAALAILVLALISAGISATFAKNSSSPAGRSLDWPGQITVAVALFALMFAVIQGPTAGWGSAEVIIGFVVAVVFLVVFVLVENRAFSIALLLIPVTARLLHTYNPRWTMGAGLALMAAGDLWTAAVPVSSQTGLGPVIAPYALIGIGFTLSVSALTAVLVDTAPNHLAGMASGAANMLRDFGFTLGPAVIGAITLSRAAA